MAEMTLFRYLHRDTVLHRMDGRLKLGSMLLLSVSASLAGALRHYLVLFCLLCIALRVAKLPWAALLKELKFFALIIWVVLSINATTIPGDPIPNLPLPGVTVQGVITGLRFAGRLINIILICVVTTGTTPLRTLRHVIEWCLRPLPFVPEVRIATMIQLTFALIPVLFIEFAEMSRAQKARCLEVRKNPIKRMYYTVLPFLEQTLHRTDQIVEAMEARGYSEIRTKAAFKSKTSDWLIFTLCLFVFLVIVFTKRG
ncbi:MAG: energy-coupling factor transporter transmembrane protein EcfT [Firmicutes bacterium]|nr:energy-coupling factor transporter transmembrane protein EcfT [Bacillota bacterium]